MKSFARLLKREFRGEIRLGEPMSRHTSFGLGGRADIYLEPVDASDVQFLLSALVSEGVPWIVFGNGTNFLIRDGGVRGAVICMKRMRSISFSGSGVEAGAGAPLGIILKKSAELGLSGMEFSAGIPATAGGAAASNAGGRFGDMEGVLSSLSMVRGSRLFSLSKDELGLGYRKSVITGRNDVIISVALSLSASKPETVKKKVLEITEYRRRVQPHGVKSAGCVFKNPENMSAGLMISSIGLSGKRVGDAEVSVKHANYIINRGRARADDVIALIEIVEQEVFRYYNVNLEREVAVIGS